MGRSAPTTISNRYWILLQVGEILVVEVAECTGGSRLGRWDIPKNDLDILVCIRMKIRVNEKGLTLANNGKDGY